MSKENTEEKAGTTAHVKPSPSSNNLLSGISLQWKVHTPGLLKEILSNPGTAMLERPLQIFAGILQEVATRASQINDPELNKLMVRLALYEISDPYSPDYDEKRCHDILAGR